MEVAQISPFDERQVCANLEEQTVNMYVWDSETYWKNSRAVPFLCSLASMENNDAPLIWDGENCINEMINWIEEVHAPQRNGFPRVHVNLYAHNS